MAVLGEGRNEKGTEQMTSGGACVVGGTETDMASGQNGLIAQVSLQAVRAPRPSQS